MSTQASGSLEHSAPPLTPAASAAPRLRRRLSACDALLLTLSCLAPVFSVYGPGSDVMQHAGTGAAALFLIAIGVAAVWEMIYAELGSAYPYAGGDYVVALRPATARLGTPGGARSMTLDRAVAACACILILTGSPVVFAQGARVPPPTAFPPSGTFPTTESVTLLDADPRATIHYTIDGSAPTAASPVFDPWRLIFIAGLYDGNRGLKTRYTIRAIAVEQGHAPSAAGRFEYLIDRRDRTAYVSQEVLPGVRMIRDSDNDKMFLLSGAKQFVLIDSGMGRGDLGAYVARFTGGRPLTVIFTHNHGDHIGQADQFVRASTEYIGAADRDGLVKLLRSRGIAPAVIAQHVVPVRDGKQIDMGDRALAIHALPGHTPGSIVIFDPKTAVLFSGDSFGSNSPTIPDAAWMQFDPNPLDGYLTEIKQVRAELGGRVKYILTGHNDRPLIGEAYLDNLERAVQLLLERGDAALVPSYRPLGLFQVIVGDRLHDPNWVAVNVNRDRYRP